MAAALLLAVVPAGLALLLLGLPGAAWPVLSGLLVFGVVFAVNSALHSFLILDYAGADRVTMDVGFYYMANAGGRLLGTVLSGAAYLLGGLPMALAVSAVMLLASGGIMGTIRSGPDAARAG